MNISTLVYQIFLTCRLRIVQHGQNSRNHRTTKKFERTAKARRRGDDAELCRPTTEGALWAFLWMALEEFTGVQSARGFLVPFRAARQPTVGRAAGEPEIHTLADAWVIPPDSPDEQPTYNNSNNINSPHVLFFKFVHSALVLRQGQRVSAPGTWLPRRGKVARVGHGSHTLVLAGLRRIWKSKLNVAKTREKNTDRSLDSLDSMKNFTHPSCTTVSCCAEQANTIYPNRRGIKIGKLKDKIYLDLLLYVCMYQWPMIIQVYWIAWLLKSNNCNLDNGVWDHYVFINAETIF